MSNIVDFPESIPFNAEVAYQAVLHGNKEVHIWDSAGVFRHSIHFFEPYLSANDMILTEVYFDMAERS